MKILDFTFATAEENLACDEALLDACEENNSLEILRFWEPTSTFAVLGFSCPWKEGVKMNGGSPLVSIYRRASGGGTVLQGLGCLNYSLILRIGRDPSLTNLKASNFYVMANHKEALSKMLSGNVEVQGYTDLTYNNLKFSGNAQRRKRNYLLFHGTFLLNFDLKQIETYLPMPKLQPAYRLGRPHLSFLTNVSLSSSEVKKALAAAWGAEGHLTDIPQEKIKSLVQERYNNPEWIYKF